MKVIICRPFFSSFVNFTKVRFISLGLNHVGSATWMYPCMQEILNQFFFKANYEGIYQLQYDFSNVFVASHHKKVMKLAILGHVL